MLRVECVSPISTGRRQGTACIQARAEMGRGGVKNVTILPLLLHFSDDSATISKERYYRFLEIEEQYKAQQQETRRLQELLEEVIRHFEDNSQKFKDNSKIIYFKEHLQKRMG